MFGNSCSNIGLKNILPITKHLASRKDVSVDFFSHLCQQPLHTFTRIKVTTMKKKFLWYSLDGSTRKICPFLIFPKKTHGLPVYQSTQFSHLECFLTAIQIYKLAMYHSVLQHTVGVVHAWVGQKRLKRNILRRFSFRSYAN